MQRRTPRYLILPLMLLAAALMTAPATALAKSGKGADQKGERYQHAVRHADDGSALKTREDLAQRATDEELERWWQGLPEHKRDRYRQRFEEFHQLPPEERDRLRERWQRFRDLPPDRQEQLRRKYQRWKDLPAGEQERLQRTWRRYRELPPGEQQRLKEELRALRDLPDQERERRRQELHRRYFPDLPPPLRRDQR
jgi:hypothetical protein